MTTLMNPSLDLAAIASAVHGLHALAAGALDWLIPVVVIIVYAISSLSKVNSSADKKRAQAEEARRDLEDRIAAEIAARRAGAPGAPGTSPPTQLPMQFRFPQSLANTGSSTIAPPTVSPIRPPTQPSPPRPILWDDPPFVVARNRPPQRPASPVRAKTVPKPRPVHRAPAPAAVRAQPDVPVVELIARPLPSDQKMIPAADARQAANLAAGTSHATAPGLPSARAQSIHHWFQPQTLRAQFILTEILQPPLALREPR
jgi:hypothetical protein